MIEETGRERKRERKRVKKIVFSNNSYAVVYRRTENIENIEKY